MPVISNLFDMKHLRYWAYHMTSKAWYKDFKQKFQKHVYLESRLIGLRPEFAEEWAELGPWNT